MKLTADQINKINEGCFNGFVFDMEHFRIQKQSQLIKIIPLSDTERIEAVIYYTERFEKERGEFLMFPTLHVAKQTLWEKSKCYPTGYQIWESDNYRELEYKKDNITTKKTKKGLQELSKEITDELIFELVGVCNDTSNGETSKKSLPE